MADEWITEIIECSCCGYKQASSHPTCSNYVECLECGNMTSIGDSPYEFPTDEAKDQMDALAGDAFDFLDKAMKTFEACGCDNAAFGHPGGLVMKLEPFNPEDDLP